MRVLVAGMGSAIGTNVALELAERADVTALAGFDLEPPRRWIPSADFQYARPQDASRVHEIVTDFRPDVVVHSWVFEPRARSSPGQARSRTIAGTEAILGACSRLDTVRRIVIRSSTSIYGAGTSATDPATIESAVRPTSTFGDIVARVEDRVGHVAESMGAQVCAIRTAPIMASNLPNPLGRYLSLPAVPVPITTRTFGVAHLGDAMRMLAGAVTADVAMPVNVVGVDPVTPMQAITIGKRIPIPVLPIAFRAGRRFAELVRTPVPEHVSELLAKGMAVAPCDTQELLGIAMRRSTPEALADLYSAGRLIEIDVDRLVGAR